MAGARYTAIDERTVRVEGSRFEPAAQYTVKLEGAAVTGYETVSFIGIRDPQILRSIDEWAEFFTKALTERVETVLELAAGSWGADLRLYGYNAILGRAGDRAGPPAEVGVMLWSARRTSRRRRRSPRLANPLLLHLPLPAMTLPAQLRVRHLSRPHRPRRGVRVRAQPRRRRRLADRDVPPGNGAGDA